MGQRHRVLACALALSLGVAGAACGSDQIAAPGATTNASVAAAAGFPATVAAANGKVTLQAAPDRIVSLSASATESLFAIGAGGQVVAVDDNSNYPAGVPKTALSAYQPNVEAIAGYDPDLVVASDDIGNLVDGLTKVGIPVALQPAPKNIDEAYGEIEQLGTLTGHKEQADEVVSGMRQRIEQAASKAPKPAKPLRYYHELDDQYYSVTSKSFVGQLYTLAGLSSIADAADKDGSGYPQLSAENIVSANPDLIFLADSKCCGQSAATVAARPGWSTLAAVTGGHVLQLDDDVASRWGPRLADLLETVSAAAATAAGSGAGTGAGR